MAPVLVLPELCGDELCGDGDDVAVVEVAVLVVSVEVGETVVTVGRLALVVVVAFAGITTP